MLRNNIIWGWICWATFRSHVIKYFSWFHLQYNDKWYNFFLPWVNTISFYNSFFRIRTGYCFYTSSSFRSFIFRLHKRWTRFTLISRITVFFRVNLECYLLIVFRAILILRNFLRRTKNGGSMMAFGGIT